jgi:hypothetical protein
MKANERKQIVSAVNSLLESVTSLVDAVESASRRVAVAAAPARGGARGGSRGGAPRGGRRGGARGGARGAWTPARTAKLKKAIASYWKKLTPEQHAERVRKMLAGRGLKPKGARAAKKK